MSLQNEIANTKKYLQNARQAILGRGGEISATAGLKDLADAIYNIPTDASIAYQTDEGVGYQVTVPYGVEKYAKLASFGGMTYKCNNLIKFPYVQASNSTFTASNDGTIAINGSGNTSFSLRIKDLELKGGTTYTLSGIDAGGGYQSYYLYVNEPDGTNRFDLGNGITFTAKSDGLASVSLVINAATQISTIVKPMLNEGSTALPYEPYYEGLRDSKVTEIKSHGANLFSASMVVGGYVSSSGQFNESSAGEKSFIAKCEPNTTYTLSKLNTTIVRVAGFASEPTNKTQGEMLKEVANNTTTATFTTRNNEYIAVFYLNNANEANTNEAVISSIMLNEGATALPYKPYREPISYPIPTEIQTGRGVNGFGSDTIDFENSKLIEKTYTIIFDGVTKGKKIEYVGISNSFYYSTLELPFKTVKNSALICSHFNPVATVALGNCYIAGANLNSFIFIPNQELTTIESVNAWLKQEYDNGNPVTVTYALAEPIETDVSAELKTFNSFINVEPRGTIEFVNEYKNDIPYSINYMIKVGGI